MLGRGNAAGGRWELRALYETPDGAAPKSLHFYIDFFSANGVKLSGGGCGGLDIANDQHPLVLSMSRRGPRTSFCYIGQTTLGVRRVVVSLTDGTTADALLLGGQLPVQLWIAFTDGTAVPVHAAALGDDGELGACEIAEEWPAPRGNVCWGLVDSDEGE